MKKICFIAQFPPPIHGLSKAVDTLYNSEISKEFQLEKVDIKNNKKIFKSLWLILKSKADLFYFTISQSKGGNLRDLVFLKLIELKRKKCLVHLHGGYYRTLVDKDIPKWQRNANYKAVSKLAGAIVLSESLKANFIGMLPDEKIFIVPNGIDDEFLLSKEVAHKKSVDFSQKKIKRVLFFSNILVDKGYRQVLELARLEKERCDNGNDKKFHFDFAGKFFEETEKEYFFNYIKENDLQDYVMYHGLVSGKEKSQILRESDIYILLSKNEGQPLSMLEALGNAMIVVTTYCGGIKDIVSIGKNAIVYDLKDDVSFLYSELVNFNCYEEFSKNNYLLAIKYYTKKQYIDNFRNLFKLIG